MPEAATRPNHRGRSLFRAMQVACVVLAAAAFLGPLLERPRMRTGRSPHAQCAIAREVLDTAKLLLATEQKLAPGTIIHESALTNYLKDQRLPRCPHGGEYTVNPIGVPASCSMHGSTEVGTSREPNTKRVRTTY